jgi:hypothetical protein
MRAELRRHGVGIEMSLPSNLNPVTGNSVQLQQVVQN